VTAQKREPEEQSADFPGEVPQSTLYTYARVWQLETWLRRLVYIELRAFSGDAWTEPFRSVERAMRADKRMTHMSTPEEDVLSFAQWSELARVIGEHWSLFAPYLPPRNLWEAKFEEVSQVRHRVAHFRSGHSDDLRRVVQLLRDIDRGVWLFCTSYNDPEPVLPQREDAVVSHFIDLDLMPWNEVQPRKWARVGVADPREPLWVTVETVRRAWADRSVPVDGGKGRLYDVRLRARQERHFDYGQLLSHTAAIHDRVAHIVLESDARSIRFTIPAVLGSAAVIPTVEHIVEGARYSLVSGTLPHDDDRAQRLADELPEYVLGPNHPLGYLSPEMPCSIFGV
jgi:hypothetical protein